MKFSEIRIMKNTLQGLNHVAITMQFDIAMRKLFDKKWFDYKTTKAHEIANVEIKKLQKKVA